MTPEKILSYKPVVLTEAQRRSYFEKGYLLVERIVPQEWIERLLEVTDEMVQRSRALTESDGIFDLEPGHSAEAPRLAGAVVRSVRIKTLGDPHRAALASLQACVQPSLVSTKP